MTEFRWADGHHLHWLWLILVLIALTYWYDRVQKRRLDNVFSPEMRCYVTASVSDSRKWIKRFLECTAIIFFILAWARPQLGEQREEIFNEGIEIVILADVSNSMLVEDVGSSRLNLMKKTLIRFIKKGGGDRIGIGIFAGSAALVSPMTSDKSVLTMYIESLTPEMLSSQGTRFSEALKIADEAFRRGGSSKEEGTVVTQAILIASDGEDHEPGALAYAKELGKQGIRVFSLGFGTPTGGRIPWQDRRGYSRGFRKSKQGKEIISSTNFSVLKELSQASQGNFYEVNFGSPVVTDLISDLNELEKSKFSSSDMRVYQEIFQWFLFVGLLLGTLGLSLRERKQHSNKWVGRMEVS